MKKFTFSFLMAGVFSLSVFAQPGNPTAYNLESSGNYSFTDWPSSSSAGTYPTSMIFHTMANSNPTLSSNAASNVTGAYNLATGTRIVGQGANGLTILNSNNGNTGYVANRLGEVVLAVNTTSRTSVAVTYTVGADAAPVGATVYGIRAQYRIGTSGSWTNIQTVSPFGEYVSSSGVGSVTYSALPLPSSCDNQPVVQIRWAYYYISGATNGQKPTLRLDDVSVTSIPRVTLSPLPAACTSDPSFVLSDGSPVGGVYSGPGVVGNVFDPALAGPGTHTVTYTYTDGNGISNFATQNITVSAGACIQSTSLTLASCGATGLSQNDFVYCEPVPNAQDFEFEFVNTGLGYSQNRIRGNAVTNIRLSAVPGLQYGQTYDVRVRAKVGGVWGEFGPVCQVTLMAMPSTQLSAGSCGASGLGTSSTITCDNVFGATNYEFTLVNTSLGYSQVRLRNQGINSIALTAFSGLTHGATYDVTVRAYVSGVWSTPGTVCQISITGGVGQTQLDGASCGATGLNRTSGIITCNTVASATQYQWRFYNGTTLVTYNYSGSNSLTLGSVSGIVPGTTYNVDVRAKVGTTWGSYSTRCAITLASGAPAMVEVIEAQRSMDVEEGTNAENFNLFPNPVEAGQQIHIAYDLPAGLDGAEMQVEVFDLSGRVVYTARATGAAGSNMVTVPVAADMQAGIYFAKTIVNGQETVIRFVVK